MNWRKFLERFQPPKLSNDTTLLLHEVIERDHSFRWKHSKVVKGEVFMQLIKELNSELGKIMLTGDDPHSMISYMQSPGSNGIALMEWPDKVDFSAVHFFEYLHDKLKELDNYRMAMNDRKVIEKKGKLLSTERYYYKPSYDLTSTPYDQQYGNITLSFEERDQQFFRVKVQASYYTDRSYQREQPFTSLVRHLFSTS